MLYANDSFVKDDFIIFSCTAVLHNNANRIEFSLAPNEGRNNWCHSKLRDFDFETFRDFFILRDQKTSGAMAPVAPPSSAPLRILIIISGKDLPTILITISSILNVLIRLGLFLMTLVAEKHLALKYEQSTIRISYISIVASRLFVF